MIYWKAVKCQDRITGINCDFFSSPNYPNYYPNYYYEEIEFSLNDPEATGFEILFHDFDVEKIQGDKGCYDYLIFNSLGIFNNSYYDPDTSSESKEIVTESLVKPKSSEYNFSETADSVREKKTEFPVEPEFFAPGDGIKSRFSLSSLSDNDMDEAVTDADMEELYADAYYEEYEDYETTESPVEQESSEYNLSEIADSVKENKTESPMKSTTETVTTDKQTTEQRPQDPETTSTVATTVEPTTFTVDDLTTEKASGSGSGTTPSPEFTTTTEVVETTTVDPCDIVCVYGTCIDGDCICMPGFEGDSCEEVVYGSKETVTGSYSELYHSLDPPAVNSDGEVTFYDGSDGNQLPAFGKMICGETGQSMLGFQDGFHYGINVRNNGSFFFQGVRAMKIIFRTDWSTVRPNRK